MTTATAAEVIRRLLDPGSFRSWDEPPEQAGHSPAYQAELEAAAARAGTDEAAVTGAGTVGGYRVAVIVSEFAFLGGSVGVATAHRIRAAVRRATREGLPLVASTATGGTRMQEGTRAFTEMAAIARDLAAHRAAGLLYLVHQRHPTTGGVLASWGSLGQLTVAEPEALLAFLGPKVYEQLTGRPFPSGVAVAENLRDHGLVDAVLSAGELRDLLSLVLGHVWEPDRPAVLERRTAEPDAPAPDAWAGVTLTRSPGHLSAADVLAGCADVVRFGGGPAVGDQPGGDHTAGGQAGGAVTAALARVDGRSAVVIAQDRAAARRGARLDPAALRLARRGMSLAQQLGLPLVTLVDTAGADLSPESENDGLAREIALCIAELVSLTVPSTSVLVGQGAGGGALALFPAATSVATPAAWLAPLPPEGASTLSFGDTSHAAVVARAQGIGAAALRDGGLLAGIVPSRAGDTNQTLAAAVLAEVRAQLDGQDS